MITLGSFAGDLHLDLECQNGNTGGPKFLRENARRIELVVNHYGGQFKVPGFSSISVAGA